MSDNGKPTGATRTVEGTAFRCYRTGIGRYEWRTDDGRCAAWSPVYRNSHCASVDGAALKPRFRSLDNAMRAAVKAAYSSGMEKT